MMCSHENSTKRVFWNLLGKEIFANISPFENNPIHGIPLVTRKPSILRYAVRH
jgi:hypothetical protein